MLEEKGYKVVENRKNRPFTFLELKELVVDVDAVIAGNDAWNEDIFKLAPELKIITRFGVGIDNIDIEKAREYGISITNVNKMNSNAVAELTVALMFGVVRNIQNLNISTRKGLWERFMTHEIAGMRVGLVGFGTIAQIVAKKIANFDVKINAFDKYPNLEKAKEFGVDFLSFEDVLKNCDIVSLHLPSLKETYHIMGEKQFSMMKDGAYFINTARGAIVDEAAFYKALKNGKLSGAAIDVYEQEPVLTSNPLFELDNIICTPHTAGETFENYRATSMVTAQAIIDYFEGKVPNNLL